MSSDDLEASLEQVITRFNLGEYEIAAYLAVLQHGELTASEISENTDIPQPRVYDTVRSLSDVGLVELKESRPMKVLAIDPREAFGDIQDSLDDLVDDLSTRYTAPAREPEAVSLVKSRPTILRYLDDIIETAEYELTLSLTPSLLDRFESQLAERRDAGIAIEILLSPASAAPNPDEFDYNSVATTVKGRRGITTPVVAVADGNYSMYATRESIRGDTDRYGVIFNRSELGFLVSGFLNTVLWTTAEVIASDGMELPFPRRYGTIRRCISDLTALDGEFYATIEGRDVETGDHWVAQGKVKEASFGPNREIATLVVETADGPVDVGGQVATYEDIEAYEIQIGRDEPPTA
ncbi:MULTISPECIES: HTH-type sugar sensing transcriptional regulator TrmB [Haloarcula]|uniref:ArsR family transcriptional regulator n=1 Tax=Haloarcula pellucida TaxID=1427151 RepID=A0A830GIC4_9EURY|nr:MULTISPECIES: TrmB family transcriptional regulator [Halomicroarcula]MBX0347486.1 TrmB family transcriptional regulator [Halomicroarcula pellucida]MDS0276639.1 TrmB family transcriptional regulator [Halomicroarcula sp. S1AR25-4]GGN88894.1 ArsR family transcriptional regulator [Halomicroarcula pellucida]